jgi:hypothetical protein
VKHRQTLAAIGGRLAAAGSGAVADVALLGTPAGAIGLDTAFTAAFGGLAPATRAPHLSALRSALAWWAESGWVTTAPTAGWARPKVPVDTTRAPTRAQVDSIWTLDVSLRDKALWKTVYEIAGRARADGSLAWTRPGDLGCAVSSGRSALSPSTGARCARTAISLMLVAPSAIATAIDTTAAPRSNSGDVPAFRSAAPSPTPGQGLSVMVADHLIFLVAS